MQNTYVKTTQFLLTAVISLLIGCAIGVLFADAYGIIREDRDFTATAASLNKQIKTDLPKMCAALGASGKQ